MAAKQDDREQKLRTLFSQLEAAGEDGEYKKGIKIADKILSVSPEDLDALHCKVVCLLHTSRFGPALKLIESLPPRGRGGGGGEREAGWIPCLFEKAYCLYRLERYEESREVLKSLPAGAQRNELLAQIAYRLEEYEEARTAYRSLVADTKDDFSNERVANYAASLALCGGREVNREEEMASLEEETMEQCFNKACWLLVEGRGVEAEKKLKKAELLCRESLLEEEEDITEEEIEGELSAVHVQLGYTLQQQGRGKDALTSYGAVLRQKSVGGTQFVIASNNVLVLNGDRDVFDSKKKVKVLLNHGSSKKLTQIQRRGILYNRALFALQTNQLDQCRQLVEEINSTHRNSKEAILARVGLMVRERKMAAAVEALASYLRSHPSSSPLLYATLAQLHSLQGNTVSVCSVLTGIPVLPSHLGAVSALLSLLSHSGTFPTALKILDEAVGFWRASEKTTPTVMPTIRSLMLFSAEYKMKYGKVEDAAAILEELQLKNPDELHIRARLVAAYSKFNPSRAEYLVREFFHTAGGTEVNVDALEQMPSFRHTRRQLLKPETGDKKTEALESKTRDKKKKKRKPKYPKDYDPSKTVDEERWLPLRERSYFRKGRKKGFAPLRGTQGLSHASANLTAMLDASKPKPATGEDLTASPRPKPKPELTASPQAKTSQQRKKQTQKKKKKGGKW